MEWSLLASQFAAELGFGVLLALTFVPPAPVGKLFYRMLGACAYLPLAAAVLAPLLADGLAPDRAALWLGFAAFAGAPLVLAGRVERGLRAALAWSTLCAALLLARLVALGPAPAGGLALGLASLSALATGAVAGSVSVAMVLGHWYLTVPKLDVAHLARLNRVAVVSLLACALVLAAECLLFSRQLHSGERSLFEPRGLFHLSTRVAVGIALPLVFAWMTAGSLRYRNTRSATGILYASTVLVLIGTAVAVSLQDAYGIPL